MFVADTIDGSRMNTEGAQRLFKNRKDERHKTSVLLNSKNKVRKFVKIADKVIFQGFSKTI